jgi:hypothetical protein
MTIRSSKSSDLVLDKHAMMLQLRERGIGGDNFRRPKTPAPSVACASPDVARRQHAHGGESPSGDVVGRILSFDGPPRVATVRAQHSQAVAAEGVLVLVPYVNVTLPCLSLLTLRSRITFRWFANALGA